MTPSLAVAAVLATATGWPTPPPAGGYCRADPITPAVEGDRVAVETAVAEVTGPGLLGYRITALTAAATLPPTLYAAGVSVTDPPAGGGREYLFRSSDDGAGWIEVGDGLESEYIISLAADPWMPEIVWAATATGLFRSSNDGVSWSRVQAAGWPTGSGAVRLAFDESIPDRLWAVGTECSTGGMGNVCDVVLRRSDDGGESWHDLTYSLVYGGLAHQAGPPHALFFGVLPASGRSLVIESLDAGQTWATAESLAEGAHVLAIAVAPPPSTVVLVGTSSGVERSADGGASWADASDGLPCPAVWELVFDPVDPESVLARTHPCGLARSIDGGRTWSPVQVGSARLSVSCVAVEPGKAGLAFIGTDEGVYSVRFPAVGRRVRRHLQRESR